MAYIYTLEVLTPLHIGSGQKLLPMEFVCDVRNNQFCLINMDAFFRANFAILPKLTRDMGDRGFNLNRDYLVEAKKYARYKIKGDPGAIANLLTKSKSGNASVSAFIKEAGNFYIPGTSIKGALNSLLRNSILKSKPDPNRIYSQNVEAELANKQRRERISNKADQAVFGNPNQSIFRFIKFSDSQYIAANNVRLSETRVLNVCDGKVKWMISPGNNGDDCTKATSTFLETIAPGTLIKGYCSLAKPTKDMIGLGKIKEADILDDFVGLIRKAVSEYLGSEVEFIERYFDNAEIKKRYQYLSQINENLQKDELLIPLAWGTGYTVKTVTRTLPQPTQQKVKKLILGTKYHENIMFPKTRRLIFHDNKPVDILGWVKFKISEVK